MNAGRKLAVGFYVPSQSFKNMPEMTAVFFVDNMGLVATRGPSNDHEIEEYATLFAKAPMLEKINSELFEALRIAENQLFQKWVMELEDMDFSRFKVAAARTSPQIFADKKDQFGEDLYPTATALTKIRKIL